MSAVCVPIIETERLRLRALCAGDLPHEIAYYSSERSRLVGGPRPEAEIWKSFAQKIGHWELRGYGIWAVEDRQSGAYYGRVGPIWQPDMPEPELNWTLVAAAEGRGIAFEASQAARAHAYQHFGLDALASLINPDNKRSIALAERLGARFEGMTHYANGIAVALYRHPSAQQLQEAAA
ncbi:MAG: GNAT family N-acetyltransferase [Neomegalonema sp.]|nr:GNAT family N-acetyltransferase [Neomegalonema sp.]